MSKLLAFLFALVAGANGDHGPYIDPDGLDGDHGPYIDPSG